MGGEANRRSGRTGEALAGRTFGSLRVRNFRLFVGGQLLSGTGTWMQGVAAPWLVLQLTHSGVALGIDSALQFLPILLFGAWGGVIADRFDNRRVQIATQAGYALVAATLWLLVWAGAVHVWMVYALSFASGLITAVDMPTRQSFYLEMVGPDELTNAMSLTTATFTGTRMIGPVIAGLVIAAGGAGAAATAPVFLINAISYLAVLCALLAMRVGELHPRRLAARAKGQVREGIRYAWRTPALRLPLLLMATVFLFAYNFSVLLPLLAVRTFSGDAGTYGLMLALFGVGSLAGALFMAARSSRPNPRRLTLFALALGAVSIALSRAPSLPIADALMVPLGFIGIAFAITGNSTLQLTAASDMRGRVMALYTVAFLGSTPFGSFAAGWVGQHLSPRVGLGAGGIVAVAAGLVALASLPWLRASAAEPAGELTPPAATP